MSHQNVGESGARWHTGAKRDNKAKRNFPITLYGGGGGECSKTESKIRMYRWNKIEHPKINEKLSFALTDPFRPGVPSCPALPYVPILSLN